MILFVIYLIGIGFLAGCFTDHHYSRHSDGLVVIIELPRFLWIAFFWPVYLALYCLLLIFCPSIFTSSERR